MFCFNYISPKRIRKVIESYSNTYRPVTGCLSKHSGGSVLRVLLINNVYMPHVFMTRLWYKDVRYLFRWKLEPLCAFRNVAIMVNIGFCWGSLKTSQNWIELNLCLPDPSGLVARSISLVYRSYTTTNSRIINTYVSASMPS